MKLAKGTAVLLKMGQSSTIGENVESAEIALLSATSTLEGLLDTPLEYAVTQDFFSYTPSLYNDSSRFKKLQLIANQAFWNDTVTPEVYFSTNGLPATADAELLLDTTAYIINKIQGTITLLVEPLEGQHTVLIRYSAGWDDGDTEIPQWLSDAGIAYAVQNMRSHLPAYSKKGMIDMSGAVAREAYGTHGGHTRTRNGSYPQTTVVEEG